MKSYLSGNPEIRLALNDDLAIGRGQGPVYGIFFQFWWMSFPAFCSPSQLNTLAQDFILSFSSKGGKIVEKYEYFMCSF